jgi:chromosome partitioning protein
MDDLDESTLGTRPTMSHVTARMEIENLLAAMGLAETNDSLEQRSRDAA